MAATATSQQLSSGNDRAPKTWAVIVGVSKYAKLPGGQQLQFAERDAALFAETIQKAGVRREDVRTLLGPQATAAAIRAAIGTWAARSASEADTIYIFFSGHGLYEREFSEGYFLAYDSDPADPYSTAVSISDLSHALARRVRARVMILADTIRQDFFNPQADGAEAAASFTDAIARLAQQRPGISAILASGPGEFSREGQRWGGHGVFTKHLIDSLSEAADGNSDGNVDAEEVYNLAAKRVAEDTSNKQHPWRAESSLAQITMLQPGRRELSKTASPRLDAPATSSSEKRSLEKPSAQKSDVQKSSAPAAIETLTKPSATIEPSRTVEPTKSAPAVAKAAKDTPRPGPSNEPSARPRSGPQAHTPAPSGRTSPAPPATRKVDSPQIASANIESRGIPTTASPPPPRPVNSPPALTGVTSSPTANRVEVVSPSVSASEPGAAPSPLLLQFEAAILSGSLLEPKSASAWDYFQRLNQQQGSASEIARLKTALVEALVKSGRAIVAGDVRGDNIADKVEDFKRAGQIFARARSLMPDRTEIAALEKLSAAQALISLQFYDEAERAIQQVQPARSAAVENALGLLLHGKLEYFRAERAFKRAIELDPGWAIPHYNLALLYRSQQNPSSLEELERAASLESGNPALLVALGDEYFNRQQWQRAADAFRKAVSIQPSDDSLRTKLGHALFSQGLRDEANLEYKKASELRNKKP